MSCSNQVVRFALSDAAGVGPSGLNISSKLEAGASGLLVRGSTAVGGVCVDYSGNMYVSDPVQHCILKIDEGGRISLFAGLPGTSGNNSALMNVAALSARFYYPMGLACDKSNNIYVADTDNNQIRVISSGRVSLVAGDGAQVTGFTDGVGAAASFNAPFDVAVDDAGVLYVADTNNHAIRQIKDGTVLTLVGNINAGVGGTAADAENVRASQFVPALRNPRSVAVDAAGQLFVCDSGNRKIKKIIQSGTLTKILLHSGSGAAGRNLGTALTSTYNDLWFCSLDRSGNLYVVDFEESGDTRLLTIDREGVPSVIADLNGVTNAGTCTIGVAVSPGQKLFVTMSDAAADTYSSSSSSSSQSSESSSSQSSESSSSQSSDSS